MLVSELGQMAAGAYLEMCIGGAIYEIKRHSAANSWNSFQAVAYRCGRKNVVAFRGTQTGGDGVTDAALGLGMNSGYYATAQAFVEGVPGGVDILCGHSLGGAIAQVVANRLGLPMVTFKAPGVGVLASQNILQAEARLLAVRTAGMVIGSVFKPKQALLDVRSAFRSVRGMNYRLKGDPVSMYGVHYGNVTMIDIPVSQKSLFEKDSLVDRLLALHSMDNFNKVLKNHPLGQAPLQFG